MYIHQCEPASYTAETVDIQKDFVVVDCSSLRENGKQESLVDKTSKDKQLLLQRVSAVTMFTWACFLDTRYISVTQFTTVVHPIRSPAPSAVAPYYGGKNTDIRCRNAVRYRDRAAYKQPLLACAVLSLKDLFSKACARD